MKIYVVLCDGKFVEASDKLNEALTIQRMMVRQQIKEPNSRYNGVVIKPSSRIEMEIYEK